MAVNPIQIINFYICVIMTVTLQRPRPHSTIGIERGSPTDSNSSDEGGKEPAWLQGPDWTRHASQTSEDSELYVSH